MLNASTKEEWEISYHNNCISAIQNFNFKETKSSISKGNNFTFTSFIKDFLKTVWPLTLGGTISGL